MSPQVTPVNTKPLPTWGAPVRPISPDDFSQNFLSQIFCPVFLSTAIVRQSGVEMKRLSPSKARPRCSRAPSTYASPGFWPFAAELPARVASASAASAVVSVVLGDPEVAYAAAGDCLARGLRVGCFRPPSVPEGTSRLRLTARATLTPEELDRVRAVLAEVLPGVRGSGTPIGAPVG